MNKSIAPVCTPKRLLIFFSILFIYIPTFSQQINNISVNDGLSSRQTFNVIQDENKFIWISTRFGIDRYDGISIKNYAIDIMHNGSYPIRTVKLLMGKNNGIWAYTDKGLIYRYDILEDNFVEFVDYKKFLKGVSFDNDNRIWAITNSELVYLQDSAWVPAERDKMKHEFYKSISSFDEKHILLQTNKNIYKHNTANNEDHPIIDPNIVSKENLHLESYLYDKDSDIIWIGSVDKGLYLYKIEEQRLLKIEVPQLLFHPVLSLCNLDDTYLLVGTDGVGIYLLNKETLKIEKHYSQASNNENQIEGGAIYNIFKDNDSRIWLSTYSAGVYTFDYLKHGFKTIKSEKGNKNSLKRNVVCDILEDSDGKIWFATNNDLSIWNKDSNTWNYILDSKNVMKIYEDSKQNIWAGTYSSGIYQFRKNGQLVKNYTSQGTGTNSVGTNFIYAIHEDSNGNIWFGGKKGSLAQFNPSTNTFKQININQINQIIDLNQDSLLISTEVGIITLNINTTKYTNSIINDKLKSSYISDMYLESDSIIWLASYGDGLNRCNRYTGTVKSFRVQEGLPSDIIYALVVDGDGKLWFSSENGIGCFDMGNYQTINFSAIDGVVGNQFRQLSKELGKNGDVYFGSYDGVTYFNPSDIKKVKRDAKLFLEDFRLFNKVVLPSDKNSPLKNSLDKTQSIELNYLQHSFSFNFIAVDYSIDKNRRYMWKLENLDDNWVGPTAEHVANYTNIQEGHYRLVIRYLDENNNIIDERSVDITVTPPFWNTIWARILFILLGILIGYAVYVYAKVQLKRKQAKEKIDFFINTAHDIRTPLTLINGPIYELKEHLTSSPKTDYLLELITNNLSKLNGIISHILDFQKVYKEKNQLVVKKWNLNKYLEEKVIYWKSAVQKKRILFDLQLPSESLDEWFDMEKMDKMLDNLVLNAIKYSHDGGIIVIKLSTNEGKWILDIVDNGIGIPKQDQNKLFTKFYRARNAINSQETGSGLGLLLVQQYIALHKGKISVKSEEDKGATFSLQFERGIKAYQNDVVLDDDSIPIADESLVSPLLSYHSDDLQIKILVVEDNDDLRQYIKTSLSPYYTVYVAENGKIAWENLLKINPDIIVSDLQMPEMDGFELCEKVKTSFETSHIPVILLTVVNDIGHVTQGFELGADDYIEKPFNIKYLTLKINNILQNRLIMRQKFLGVNKQEIKETETLNTNNLNIQFINRVTAIIDENLSNAKFSIKDLSSEMELSRTLLFSKFNAITGYTPNDYIKIMRMKKAIFYFKENKYTISEVALMVGFEEHSYFSTSFKKMYGKTPKQFIEDDLLDDEKC